MMCNFTFIFQVVKLGKRVDMCQWESSQEPIRVQANLQKKLGKIFSLVELHVNNSVIGHCSVARWVSLEVKHNN
jgi:hypothetical protein